MIKVGIVGVGAIGAELARRCVRDFKDEVRFVGIHDTDVSRVKALSKSLGLKRTFTLKALIKQCDLVIEAASSAAAFNIAKQALTYGKDVMLMSSGGLIGNEKEIYELAASHRCCVYLPSGAVCGLDGLKSAQIGRVKRVELTTRKPPVSLRNAPHIIKKKIDLNTIKEETLVFEGTAAKAIIGFPQNVNISATLSLAGVGAQRTKVKIYACPGLEFHVHEVIIEGDFGSLYTRTQNKPSTINPKTSQMAILSAVATLKRILGNVKVGT
ncbi:MAG: aspartate dehydrogenase [Candidatus Omnitrophota bacterium]|jgi:aspartate dehydrogenase